MVEKRRLPRVAGAEREVGDKERNRETDTAEHRHGEQTFPVAPVRHRRPSELDAKPREAENTQRLAHYQAEDDGEADAGEYRSELESGKRYPGVGEGEQRYYHIVDHRVKRVFHILKRRNHLVGSGFYLLQVVELFLVEYCF